MKEAWKDIEGYEGLYQISNLGRVKSLNYNKTGKPKIMKSHLNSRGYYVVALSKCGAHASKYIHVLLAQAFIPNPEGKPTVDHINRNKTDNRIENLRWATRLEQTLNCDPETNRRSAETKRKNGDYEKLKEMNKELKGKAVIGISLDDGHVIAYETIRTAKKDGFDSSGICACCKGKKKQYKGYVWKYI